MSRPKKVAAKKVAAKKERKSVEEVVAEFQEEINEKVASKDRRERIRLAEKKLKSIDQKRNPEYYKALERGILSMKKQK